MHTLLCFTILTFSQLQILFVESKLGGFSIELIHLDSPLSPLYNHSITSAELLRKAALSSVTRINHFRSYIDQKTIQSVVIPNGGAYLMKFSIGTPPNEVLAIADTGSDLIWIQCTPCERCYNQEFPIFDPKMSSTYKELSCVSEPCTALPKYACGNINNECRYYYSYGDKSYTIGVLTTDTFTFSSTNGQAAAFPTSVFGCGNNNNGTFNSRVAGLVGLGGGPLSLVSQLGDEIDHKFSYCLLPPFTSSRSKLRFGQEADISREGIVSTPLITKSKPTFYYLTLEGISIGNKTLQTAPREGNIIIDSGTTLTILESSLYDNLEAVVKEAIGQTPVQDPTRTFDLCYETQSNINVPDVMFHFTKADLLLKPLNTFIKYNNLDCFTFAPSDDLSVFGNLAQVNFQVEYNLKEKQVSFAPADCTKE